MDPQRVENSVGDGTPDINYSGGWIESKMVDFPKRTDTILRVPHYTPQQRAWHVRRIRAGGVLHVIVQDKTSSTETLVFDGLEAATALGSIWSLRQCRKSARLYMIEWDPYKFRRFIVSACRAQLALLV